MIIENFRPGVMTRFGLDAATLMERNEQLIYCSVTGWGQQGPWKDRRAYAPVVHAEVGYMEWASRHRRRRPEYDSNQHADVYSALAATSAILAAVIERATTARGQHIDLAMGEVAFYVNEWAAASLNGPIDDFGGFDTWNHYTYPHGDGTYVGLVGNPVEFPLWAPHLGAPPEVVQDPRFATREARADHVTELVDAIDCLTSRFQTVSDLQAVLAPGMLAAQVRSVSSLAESKWALHRGLNVEVAPGLPVPRKPWITSTGRVGARRYVGALGADNEEVLESFEFPPDEIRSLTSTGVLCRAPMDHSSPDRDLHEG